MNEPTTSESLLERLERLRQEGDALADRLRNQQSDVEATLAKYVQPNPVSVTVTRDERGFLTGLEISGPAEERDAKAYLEAINSEILLAQAEDVRLPTEAIPLLLESFGTDDHNVTVKDDFGGLTVTAAFGEIRGVRAERRWIESSSDSVIAGEVLRIAQQAARESDQFNRFTDGEHDG